MSLSLYARSVVMLAVCLFATGLQAASSPGKAEIEAALNAAYAKYKNLQEGANADYIPALAKVDSNIYGIALVTPDGDIYTAGDVKSEVSIQSISKVFTLALVMDEKGPEAISNNMGVDATGQVFNSIIAIEQYKGAEMNPLVNAGAITATSMVSGGSREEIWNKILNYYNAFAGRELTVNQEVFESEAATNQRNQAIAVLCMPMAISRITPPRQRIFILNSVRSTSTPVTWRSWLPRLPMAAAIRLPESRLCRTKMFPRYSR